MFWKTYGSWLLFWQCVHSQTISATEFLLYYYVSCRSQFSAGDGTIYCIVIKIMFLMFLIFSESFQYCYFLRFQNRGHFKDDKMFPWKSRQSQGQLHSPGVALANTKGCSEIRRNICISRCHVKLVGQVRPPLSCPCSSSKAGSTKLFVKQTEMVRQGGSLAQHETDKWQKWGIKQGLLHACAPHAPWWLITIFLHGE